MDYDHLEMDPPRHPGSSELFPLDSVAQLAQAVTSVEIQRGGGERLLGEDTIAHRVVTVLELLASGVLRPGQAIQWVIDVGDDAGNSSRLAGLRRQRLEQHRGQRR